MIILVLVN